MQALHFPWRHERGKPPLDGGVGTSGGTAPIPAPGMRRESCRPVSPRWPRLRRERDLDAAERPEIHPHAVPGLHPHRRRERPADDAVAGAEPLAEGGKPVRDVAHHRGEIAGRGRRLHAGDLVAVAERARGHARERAAGPLGPGRPEHRRAMEDVGGQDRLQVVQGPVDVDQLDRRAERGDRGTRRVSAGARRDVPPEVDRDLRLGAHQVGAGERVARPGREQGRLREMADHRAVEAELPLHRGRVEADLPPDPRRAARDPAPPAGELGLHAAHDAWIGHHERPEGSQPGGEVLPTPVMDLSYTPEELAFQREVRAWLRRNVPGRHLPKILTAEEIWCQGYSEPGAGSDLASLRTRAELRGDEFVVNGQKVWTSNAQYADWMFCLVRTDPDAPRHAGISYVLIDMRTPGITVRPLVQMTGDAGFNEVFLEDVRVPRANLVGQLNAGWQVANATLGHERNMLGSTTRTQQTFQKLVRLARTQRRNGGPASEDPVVRQRLADLAIRVETMRLEAYRQLTDALHGRPPGISASVNKLVTTELNHDIARAALDVLGSYGPLHKRDPRVRDAGVWPTDFMYSLGLIIGGGTSQIQKNIIAERGLGMPREARGR